MFDLENAITAWRSQMCAAGVKTPAVLDELESHLRDDVEHQVRSGMNPAHAFEAAVQRLGHASTISTEFEADAFKIANPDQDMKQRITNILTLVATVAMGVALILPEIDHWHQRGSLPIIGVFLLLLGTLCVGIGVFVTLRRVKASTILAIIFMVPIGVGLILPAADQWRSQGALTVAGMSLFILGCLCVGIGVFSSFRQVKA